MPRSNRLCLFAAVRPHGASAWIPRLVQALALTGLFMLPVQMRAGSDRPHPHALFQLLLDARDGRIEHHEGQDEGAVSRDLRHTVAPRITHHPDLPAIGDSIQTGGSLALLATLVTALLLSPAGSTQVWPTPRPWHDRIPTLEPPPPRLACA
jgi:hypothetical protein